MKALLPLLCLCLIALSTSRPPFQPVRRFNANKLLGVDWYEPFFADTATSTLVACPREVYTSIGNGRIAAQEGEYSPGLNGDFDSSLLIVKQQGNSGRFKVLGESGSDGYYYVLDYDYKNYNWIVFAVDLEGDESDVLILISKTPQNLDGLQRAVDLAEKYGFGSHHLELQTPKCDYANIFAKLKEERKNC